MWCIVVIFLVLTKFELNKLSSTCEPINNLLSLFWHFKNLTFDKNADNADFNRVNIYMHYKLNWFKVILTIFYMN